MSFLPPLPFVGAAGAALLAVGALIRGRRTVADWALAGGMAALAAEGLCTGWLARRPLPLAETIGLGQWRLTAAALLPGLWLLFSLSYARGNGREFLTRWRWAWASAFLLPLGLVTVFRDRLLVAESYRRVALGWSGFALHALLLASAVLILMNLERTFRASVGTMRWRIKFMAIGVGLIFVVRVYTSSQALLFRGENPSLAGLGAGALVLAAPLILRSFFREGRTDLDVYPSHLLLQGSVTILLAGLYLFIVGICAKAVAALGGGAVFELEAFLVLISLVLAVVLLQSDRLRMRLGRFVSRHFRRPLYDYRTVWSKFIEGTTSQVELPELCRALVKLVADLFQTLSVTLWLVEDQNLTLAASTFLSGAQGRALAPGSADAKAMLAYFHTHPDPVDLQSAQPDWLVHLRRMHPSEFPRCEDRVCLPLIARGEVAALLILGDRVNGAAFSAQDFDLLRCVGDHAAANLANVRLSQKLLHAKELEAFQMMAAFLVHDLKNAASTLSLTLKNLPVHFEHPAFREDALRGVATAVTHINQVIGRLGLLRHELKLKPAELDLNTVVDEAVAGLESGPDFLILKELAPLPKLTLDREQIANVVTNLVLNAKEAMAGKGSLHIATHRENGWAVLAVSDRGCGMSEEFIARSLFRPFQTTKKNGLGIGMFQSKMIVEVHGGRIAVASAPGAGTTFKILLPVPSLPR